MIQIRENGERIGTSISKTKGIKKKKKRERERKKAEGMKRRKNG